MFINFTNHSTKHWCREQLEAAAVYGELLDIPFPAVDPCCGEKEISELARKYAEQICLFAPDAVLVQGEMSLCFAVISALLRKGITVLCATTERISSERIGKNGETVSVSEFRFVRFRKYFCEK